MNNIPTMIKNIPIYSLIDKLFLKITTPKKPIKRIINPEYAVLVITGFDTFLRLLK